jgi:hypothetical protein
MRSKLKQERVRLTRVEEWTRGRAAFPALVSVFLVEAAESIYHHMTRIVEHGAYAMLFKGAGGEEWSRMYCQMADPATVARIWELMPGFPGAELRERVVPELRRALRGELWNEGRIVEFLRTKLLDDFHWVEQECSECERVTLFARVLEMPFVAYACRVVLPCVVYYQSLPGMLLGKAKKGDVKSLVKLLRLDWNLLAVPEVLRIWEGYARDSEGAAFKKLKGMLNKPPYKSSKAARVRTRVKVVVAVWIEELFRGVEEPISRMEIRDLYDRFAQDTRGTLIDEDLPGTENGFDEAIRRERKAWEVALEPVGKALEAALTRVM